MRKKRQSFLYVTPFILVLCLGSFAINYFSNASEPVSTQEIAPTHDLVDIYEALYYELYSFKTTIAFRDHGFTKDPACHQWLVDAKALTHEDKASYLMTRGLVVNNLLQLGLSYQASKGQETEATKTLNQAILQTLPKDEDVNSSEQKHYLGKWKVIDAQGNLACYVSIYSQNRKYYAFEVGNYYEKYEKTERLIKRGEKYIVKGTTRWYVIEDGRLMFWNEMGVDGGDTRLHQSLKLQLFMVMKNINLTNTFLLLVLMSSMLSCNNKRAGKAYHIDDERLKTCITDASVLIGDSTPCDSVSSDYLQLDFFRKNPRTAQDLNLKGPVKSIRVRVYAIDVQADTLAKTRLIWADNEDEILRYSYKISFDREGKCSKKIGLAPDDEVVPMPNYYARMDAKYTYQGERVMKIKSNAKGENLWEVDFIYASPELICYQETAYFYTGYIQERIHGNLVRELYYDLVNGYNNSYFTSHKYTYNRHQDIAKEMITLTSYSPLYDSSIETDYKYVYSYTYDKYGNWLTKLKNYNDGFYYSYCERIIEYYQ